MADHLVSEAFTSRTLTAGYRDLRRPTARDIEARVIGERLLNTAAPVVEKAPEWLVTDHSPGTFVEIIDLTNAIFKKLTLRDYHKELLVLTVAAHEQASYEWEQHVSVARAAGVSERQFTAITEDCFDDPEAVTEDERVLLRFGRHRLLCPKTPCSICCR